MTNNTKTVLLTSLPTARRMDVRVTWREGYKPTAFPHTHGTTFIVKGRTTWIRWDGETKVSIVATGALVTA